MATLVAAWALSACGSSDDPSAEPTDVGWADNGTAANQAADSRTVTIATDSGLGLSFDVVSCESPDSDVVDLQGASQSGDQLELRASVVGTMTITGSSAGEGQVTSVEVSDGSIEAAGTITFADDPTPTEFALSGDCS